MRVLVIDDDEALAQALAEALRREGFEVGVASDPLQALERLESGAFDWLISDVRMTPLDGRELATRAKGLAPRLKIILMSGLDCEATLRDCPIEAFFEKPVALDRLIARLRGG